VRVPSLRTSPSPRRRPETRTASVPPSPPGALDVRSSGRRTDRATRIEFGASDATTRTGSRRRATRRARDSSARPRVRPRREGIDFVRERHRGLQVVQTTRGGRRNPPPPLRLGAEPRHRADGLSGLADVVPPGTVISIRAPAPPPSNAATQWRPAPLDCSSPSGPASVRTASSRPGHEPRADLHVLALDETYRTAAAARRGMGEPRGRATSRPSRGARQNVDPLLRRPPPSSSSIAGGRSTPGGARSRLHSARPRPIPGRRARRAGRRSRRPPLGHRRDSPETRAPARRSFRAFPRNASVVLQPGAARGSVTPRTLDELRTSPPDRRSRHAA